MHNGDKSQLLQSIDLGKQNTNNNTFSFRNTELRFGVVSAEHYPQHILWALNSLLENGKKLPWTVGNNTVGQSLKCLMN